MSRNHRTVTSLARRLRPTAADFAAAAAVHDPSYLLRLQAGQRHLEQSVRPAPPRRRRRLASIRRAMTGETGGGLLLGALLDQAKVGILATALLVTAR